VKDSGSVSGAAWQADGWEGNTAHILTSCLCHQAHSPTQHSSQVAQYLWWWHTVKKLAQVYSQVSCFKFSCKFMQVFVQETFTTNMADKADRDAAAAAVAVIAVLAHEKLKSRKWKRNVWRQPWIVNRTTHGTYHALLHELSTTPWEHRHFFYLNNLNGFKK